MEDPTKNPLESVRARISKASEAKLDKLTAKENLLRDVVTTVLGNSKLSKSVDNSVEAGKGFADEWEADRVDHSAVMDSLKQKEGSLALESNEISNLAEGIERLEEEEKVIAKQELDAARTLLAEKLNAIDTEKETAQSTLRAKQTKRSSIRDELGKSRRAYPVTRKENLAESKRLNRGHVRGTATLEPGRDYSLTKTEYQKALEEDVQKTIADFEAVQGSLSEADRTEIQKRAVEEVLKIQTHESEQIEMPAIEAEMEQQIFKIDQLFAEGKRLITNVERKYDEIATRIQAKELVTEINKQLADLDRQPGLFTNKNKLAELKEKTKQNLERIRGEYLAEVSGVEKPLSDLKIGYPSSGETIYNELLGLSNMRLERSRRDDQSPRVRAFNERIENYLLRARGNGENNGWGGELLQLEETRKALLYGPKSKHALLLEALDRFIPQSKLIASYR